MTLQISPVETFLRPCPARSHFLSMNPIHNFSLLLAFLREEKNKISKYWMGLILTHLPIAKTQ